MASPATLGMGATALGGGVSAIGSLMSGGAQAGMYQYQAGVAKVNQRIALQNADYERAVGTVEAQRSGMKSRFTAGNIITGQVAKGFKVNSGSNAAVTDSANLVARMDQQTIQDNSLRRAYGHDIEAYKEANQESIYKAAGENAETAGQIGAISSILGSASSVSSKWYQGRQSGVWT